MDPVLQTLCVETVCPEDFGGDCKCVNNPRHPLYEHSYVYQAIALGEPGLGVTHSRTALARLGQLGLCGGCHQWGCNPIFEKDQCTACHRSPEQIRDRHGIVNLQDLYRMDLPL